MPKTHFLVSDTPQKFGASIEVLCGKTLKNPEPVVIVELMERGMPKFFINDCGKCIEAAVAGIPVNAGRFYLYGVIEGEPKNAQADAA